MLVGHDGAGVGGAVDADHQKLGELVAGGQGVDHGRADGAVGAGAAVGADGFGEASPDGGVDDPDSRGITTNTTVAASSATASTANATGIHRDACNRRLASLRNFAKPCVNGMAKKVPGMEAS